MKRTLLFVSLLVVSFTNIVAQTLESDPLINAMKEELKYNYDQLSKLPVPAYFLSLRYEENSTLEVRSIFGSSVVSSGHSAMVTPQVRVGTPEFDNFKYDCQGSAPGARNARGYAVHVEGDVIPSFREAIWTETMNRYRIARGKYESAVSKQKTSSDNEDKAPCFVSAPAEKYYEKPVSMDFKGVDVEKWKSCLDKVTSVFKECNELSSCSAVLICRAARTIIVNTDGTAVSKNFTSARLFINTDIKADDGMDCPLSVDFFGFDASKMPDEATLIAAAKDLVARSLAIKSAPVAEPYSGPAILASSSSGVFFHEIFGHRLEAHRMKRAGQSFKKMVGQKVLPESFSVYSDPTLRTYAGEELNGYYLYDDEGVKAQRVVNVKDGILTDFLLNSTPIDGFPKSNGHGRAAGGTDPVARQSNLIIETSKPYKEEELRKMLIEEAKRQGKEYGYYFLSSGSGLTYFGDDASINAFNVEPREVYKVYVDGRPDQLVRGVKLIGTPLSVFSNITAGGASPKVFEGDCGAESGWVPVTAVSPSVLVSNIETQRSQIEHGLPYILPKPAYGHVKVDENTSEEDVIFKAMKDEMARTKKELRTQSDSLPWKIDYRMQKYRISQYDASLGGLTYNYDSISNYCSSIIMLGDSMLSSVNRSPDYYWHLGGDDVDYDNIRNMLWYNSDASYKAAIKSFAGKRDALKKRPVPEDDAAIPEYAYVPAVKCVRPSALGASLDSAMLKRLVMNLSRVFVDYPTIYGSSVSLPQKYSDNYRVTTDGVELRVPNAIYAIRVSAMIRTVEGSEMRDELTIPVCGTEDLPSEEELVKVVKDFADLMLKKAAAPTIKEYYVGPMLLEDEAVSECVLRPFAVDDRAVCVAKRDMYTGSSESSMLLGKRVMDTNWSIEHLTHLDSYKGRRLVGNYDIDADGTVPADKLVLVENGVLKNLLCGNQPAIGAPKTTGNERFVPGTAFSTVVSPGIIRATVKKTVNIKKLKAMFLSQAKKEKLKYAYIIKAPRYGWRYLVRLNVETGEEEIVRVNIIPQPSRRDMLHVLCASDEEFVTNKHERTGLVSSITPKAIVVENMEYNFTRPSRTEPFLLKHPSERQKDE